MKYYIIIAILICVILFILYKYIQAKQIISDKKGEIKTSEALFNFIFTTHKVLHPCYRQELYRGENELLRNYRHRGLRTT